MPPVNNRVWTANDIRIDAPLLGALRDAWRPLRFGDVVHEAEHYLNDPDAWRPYVHGTTPKGSPGTYFERTTVIKPHWWWRPRRVVIRIAIAVLESTALVFYYHEFPMRIAT